MRQFKVRINDEEFEVEVEEIGGIGSQVSRVTPVQAPAAAPQAVTPRPAPVARPAPKAPAAPTAPKAGGATGDVVRAPIPGVVTEVKVAAGASVKKGDILLLLEAMKMQNEILAPHDAVVTEVAVAQGASVQTGDVLVKL